LGVKKTCGPDQDEFLDAVRSETKGVGADLVIECAGQQDGLDLAVKAAANGGRVAIVGIPAEDFLPVDPNIWRRKELQIVYVRRSNQVLPRMIRLMARSGLGLERAGYFSSTVGLSGLQEAFQSLDDPPSKAVKVILDPRLDS
jgi:threonine dehydrogenase-like Zn-dependent dehydrogenase